MSRLNQLLEMARIERCLDGDKSQSLAVRSVLRELSDKELMQVAADFFRHLDGKTEEL